MDYGLLSSRAIVGEYYLRLESPRDLFWLEDVANLFTSDQMSEKYVFTGMTPAMREWVGQRHAKGFLGNELTITNKHFEATIEIPRRDLRRDKTGQVMARIGELAQQNLTHWAILLSNLILSGETTLAYDGQFFFATGHTEGASGTQSNKISVTIAGLPAVTHGTTSAPSMEEMQQSILKGVVQIITLLDDQGQPMNEMAGGFTVIVPPNLYTAAAGAINPLSTANIQQNFNPNALSGLNIRVAMNTRLSSWTTKFVVFRNDSPIRALIRQEETPVQVKSKAEGSEYEFDNDAWQFGIDAWRNVGYGFWQRACLVTLA